MTGRVSLPHGYVASVETWRDGGCAWCGTFTRDGMAFTHDSCQRIATSCGVFGYLVSACEAALQHKEIVEPPKHNGIVDRSFTTEQIAAIDSMFRFVCGLRLDDHPKETQREALAHVSAVGPILNPSKAGR